MATRTWDGTSGNFDDASHWSGGVVPTSGDTAVIAAGTVASANETLNGLTIQLGGNSTVPTLSLNGDTITANTTVTTAGTGGNAALQNTGVVTNQGQITLSGTSSSVQTVSIGDSAGGSWGGLVNAGTVSIVGSSPTFSLAGSNGNDVLVNNGTIALSNPSQGYQSVLMNVGLSGSGTTQLGTYSAIDIEQGVGNGQTIQFAAGAHNATLQIDHPAWFGGAISGFAPTDTLTLRNTPFTSYTYTSTGQNTGTLTLSNNGTTTATLNLVGSYSQNSFNLTFNDFGGGSSSTVITEQDRFSYTDTVNNVSGSDPGQAYTGPVNYLQWQYIWGSSDGVAIGANVPNVFIHGGPGDDAIAVSGGSNVLDGGTGSNFLVGANGADGGSDTFFVDGRNSGDTWSTVVNFHHGDAVTIFGFTPGTSTYSWTASDGAQGYQGATIHSSLDGSGTIDASVTFAGVSEADALSKFTVLTGTTGDTPYMYVAYTG